MRAAPAFQVSVRRFGVWRTACAILTAAGWTALIAWGTAQERASGLYGALALAALLGGPAVAAASLLAGAGRFDLRWDGKVWHLGAPPSEAWPGDLAVAFDLGPWMLLRFTPEWRRRAVWLPLQRRGLENDWHALRCAVYSPLPVARPAAGPAGPSRGGRS